MKLKNKPNHSLFSRKYLVQAKARLAPKDPATRWKKFETITAAPYQDLDFNPV